MKRGTYLEINLSNYEYNLKSIIEYVKPKQFLPIIKANAYGMGANAVIDILNRNSVKTVCVAIVPEALELKQNGYNGDIIVLDPCTNEELNQVIENDYILGMCSEQQIIELNKKAQEKNKTVRVHLEIEAGSFRAGIRIDDLKKYVQTCKNLQNICIEGIYVYFAGSAKDERYVQYQFDTIKQAVTVLNENGINLKCVHMANLELIHEVKNDEYITALRSGLVLYGHDQNDSFAKKLDIKPVSKLISKISFLKEVEKGESISYGRTYIATKKEKIATVPIGYADGLSRALSNKGKVVINNQICSIVGTVCMDSILVDVSNLDDVKCGDTVYIWDNENITVEDLARNSNTINYEVISRIALRVERKYVQA